MVDQIVGRFNTTMRNTDDTTSIDIDVLQERQLLKRLNSRLTIQYKRRTSNLKVLFHGDEKPLLEHLPN